jgi:benzoyl-CoA 2,3-dioxygenase component B
MITDEEWHAKILDWLPSDADRDYVESLQVGVTEPGKMAGWVAPPSQGTNQKPAEFEYVRL